MWGNYLIETSMRSESSRYRRVRSLLLKNLVTGKITKHCGIKEERRTDGNHHLSVVTLAQGRDVARGTFKRLRFQEDN